VKPCAQTVIGAEIVCDHRAADGHVLANEAFQGFRLGVGGRADANFASFISDAGNCGSADCSTSSAELLAGVLVTLFSTKTRTGEAYLSPVALLPLPAWRVSCAFPLSNLWVIKGLLLTGGLRPVPNVRKPVGGLRRNKGSILNVLRRRS